MQMRARNQRSSASILLLFVASHSAAVATRISDEIWKEVREQRIKRVTA